MLMIHIHHTLSLQFLANEVACFMNSKTCWLRPYQGFLYSNHGCGVGHSAQTPAWQTKTCSNTSQLAPYQARRRHFVYGRTSVIARFV